MQSNDGVTGWRALLARIVWNSSRLFSVFASWVLSDICRVSKQHANRVMEPYMLVNFIVSGTEWLNFLGRRMYDDAQPEMRDLAMAIGDIYFTHNPQELKPGEWHIPYDPNPEEGLRDPSFVRLRASAGQCARESYQGPIKSQDENIELAGRLEASGHWTPLEHQARAETDEDYRQGCLMGFRSFRSTRMNEDGGDYSSGAYKKRHYRDMHRLWHDQRAKFYADDAATEYTGYNSLP